MNAAQQHADAARVAATAVFAALNPSNPSSLPPSPLPALMLTLGMQPTEQESLIISAALSELPLERFVAWYKTRLQLAASRPLDGGSCRTPAAAQHAAPTAVTSSSTAPVQQAANAAAPVGAANASSAGAAAATSAGPTVNGAAASSGSTTLQFSLQLSAPVPLDPTAAAAHRRQQRGLLAAAWLAAYDELLRVPLAFLAQNGETRVACEELAVLKHDVQMVGTAGTYTLAPRVLSADHLQACMAITAERVRRLKVRCRAVHTYYHLDFILTVTQWQSL
jgi:hypothetical protein